MRPVSALPALLLLALATPAAAGVTEAVEGIVLPGVDRFAEATTALAATAAADCTAEAVRPAYQAAWDAWGPIADLRLGPSESGALSIAFWPDERGAGGRAIAAMLAGEDPAGRDPAAFAQVSVAARGLPALDLLLYGDASGYAAGSYACDLVQTVTADLAAQGAALAEGWAGEAEALVTAGAPGNARYMAEDEAFRALYTQVLSGLEFTADTRLGRPLGDFDRPRPTRAEAWRSGRPLAEATASMESLAAIALLLDDDAMPQTEAALASARLAAEAIRDPSFQDIDDPQAWLRLQILQQRVRALGDAVEAELGRARGLQPGFNSQDGD